MIGWFKSKDTPTSFNSAGENVCLLLGNPNVGKSSLFNRITGLRRHTGNWTGKSVDCAVAKAKTKRGTPSFYVADLPGCYSLLPSSPEEEETVNFICSPQLNAAVVVVVCETTTLARNLLLAYQLKDLNAGFDIVLCINLIDEAERLGWKINADLLGQLTGFPVYLTSAQTGAGVSRLVAALGELMNNPQASKTPLSTVEKTATVHPAATYYTLTKDITAQVVSQNGEASKEKRKKNQAWYKYLRSKPVTLFMGSLLLFAIFWLTIYGANVPSALLTSLFESLGAYLHGLSFWGHLPSWIKSCLLEGVYDTVTHVVAVMLPPMAIFFPLFTLMEDIGLLPRVAFHADACFQRCGTGGKQALTMCMSCGCHSVGVMGCRIISNNRDRLVAILTASLMPCNGKFPTLLAVASAFLSSMGENQGNSLGESLLGAGIMTCLILLTVVCTWIATFVVRKLIFGGEVSPFIMEIPPFRRPRAGTILVRSLLDRTIFVLGRAVAVAAPMGCIVWLCGYVPIGDRSLLWHMTNGLDPIGMILGVDGAILVALLLSAAANELVLPTLLTIYGVMFALSEDTLTLAFAQHPIISQWNVTTLICFTLLFLFHAPCATTLLTIKKETGKWRYVLGAVAIPVIVGLTLCLVVNGISHCIGWL